MARSGVNSPTSETIRRAGRTPLGLTFSGKVSRLAERLRQPQWRRYGAQLLLGKALGLLVLAFAVLVVPKVPDLLLGGSSVYAQADSAPAAVVTPATTEASTTAPTTAPAAAPAAPTPYDTTKGGDIINPINTLWTLLGAFLVFGMQAGFTMLEAGFCRSRETVNVLVECVFDTCLCGILYYAWGYAFMFGAGNGLIGWHDPNDATKSWFFLQNIDATTLFGATGIPVLAHWLFQFAFADCASTICSGTMIGRTSFWGDILYSICVSGFIYPILGHWAWGPDGFLYTMGNLNQTATWTNYTHFLPSFAMNFHDFAGSTIVHSIGGWIALAGGIWLGPRLGRKFKRDGGGPMLPHDLTIAVVGGLILWFGWYGFNPGSTLSAMDFAGIGRIAANTTLAACGGGLSAVIVGYTMNKKWDAGFITNGFLAGLVAITCPCYWVSPTGAIIIGLVGGILVVAAAEVLEYFRIDDPVGAWPVHGVNGIWGTLSLGLFATGQYSAAGSSFSSVPTPGWKSVDALTGLFYGGGAKVLEGQIIGSFIICAATFAIAMIMFGILNALGVLRISKEGEIEGMDLHEHGISAYPEYVLSPSAAPAGMPAEMINAHLSTARMSHDIPVGGVAMGK